MEFKANIFHVTPRVIAHLGDSLIRNESIALLELIKNSYDANATRCEVYFEEINGSIARINITDNGCGMSEEVIRNAWLVIGTDNKKKLLEQDHIEGRYPLGEKGIGRLGVHKLGRKIRLISKMSYADEVELNIDWDKLNEVETIEEFPVNVEIHQEPTEFQQGETGTKIIIESLKNTPWDRRQLREVYRNIMSLNSPFENTSDQFKVTVSSNNPRLFAGLPVFEDIIANGGMYFGHCVMSGKEIKEFRYEFKPWPTLTKSHPGRVLTKQCLPEYDWTIVGYRESEESRKKEKYEIDLDAHNIGDVAFDIVIFEKDSAIFNFAMIERATVNQYLSENGGIRVYRDNVRVYDYGERDNDWLGVDLRRVNRAGGNISNNIILGAVRLNRKESQGLQEKTNREGFIENEAYFEFKDAVNYVLSLFVRYRNEDKEKLTTIYKTHKTVEPVMGELQDAVDLVNGLPESDTKEEILRCLTRVDKQYQEVKNVLLKSANAGLSISVVIHEIDKQVAALMGSAERGENERVLTIANNIEDIVQGYTALIRKSDYEVVPLSEAVHVAIKNFAFRFRDHEIRVIDNSDSSSLKARILRAQTISIIDNLLDNSIFWLSYTEINHPTISVYITDQIRGYHSVIISDNGPGFNISPEVAVKPFITGKPNNMGMGIGLHLANELMNEMKGKLVFYEKDDLELPDEVVQVGATKAIIALCFPVK